jgi:pimeloyl-ACP methyl ester carboxylesterase
MPNRIDVARNKKNKINSRKVAIFFVPGVMGSRLEFVNTGVVGTYKWDPDSTYEMAFWLGGDAIKKRNMMHPSKSVKIMTKIKGITETEELNGYGTVANSFYLEFLRYTQKYFNDSTVYAIGYDWRQSNWYSAQCLNRVVEMVMKNVKATHCIFVTHSMGGLVTRAALKQSAGLAAKTLGVVHVVQPAHGAAVAYRRYFTGARKAEDGGWGFSKVLGNTPDSYTILSSALAGPMELMPTTNYRDLTSDSWIRFTEKGKPDEIKKWTDGVYDLYKSADSPPGLMSGNLSANWAAVRNECHKLVDDANGFHNWLGVFKHNWTFAIYSDGSVGGGSGADSKTDLAVQFNFRDRTYTETAHDNRSTDSTHDMRVGTQSNGYRRADTIMFRRPEGDSTVPAMSGYGLFPNQLSQSMPANVREVRAAKRQFRADGVPHGDAFINWNIIRAVAGVAHYLKTAR